MIVSDDHTARIWDLTLMDAGGGGRVWRTFVGPFERLFLG